MGERCPDCQVDPGLAHLDGCDVARCLWTGMQRLQCVGEFGRACQLLTDAGHPDLADQLGHYLGLTDWDHQCGDDIWTGEWPGRADARRLGLWVVDRCAQGEGWVRAHRGDPGARPDLNSLHGGGFLRWVRGTGRWEWRSDDRPTWWRETDQEAGDAE